MRPFLRFAKWANRVPVETLKEHGLDAEIGSWTLEASGRYYRRMFTVFAIPCLTPFIISTGALTFGEAELARTIEESMPLPILVVLFFTWQWHRQGGRPHPLALLEDLLIMAGNLATFDDDGLIIADAGYKWPNHAAVSAQIQSCTDTAEVACWKFATRVAKLAGNRARERTNPRWNTTSRTVLYAIEQPLNRRRRNLAYQACITHINQLYKGRLFEPVPQQSIPDLPALRAPRLRARIQDLLHSPTTYTVAGALVAASVSPLLTALLRP